MSHSRNFSICGALCWGGGSIATPAGTVTKKLIVQRR